jgi:phosphate transport system protein
MEHLQAELDSLRSELSQMCSITLEQLKRAEKVFLNNDRSVLKEITSNEKLVNAKELQIDSRCETILALFTPVAVDLRFILSALRMNANLERIGDLADGIGRTVAHSKENFDKALLENIDAHKAFSCTIDMFESLIQAYEKEDTLLARDIFTKDKIVDGIVDNGITIAEEHAKNKPDSFSQSIQVLSVMKMLERVGDHLKNIAEEIIFYAEARVLKHSAKKNNTGNGGPQ